MVSTLKQGQEATTEVGPSPATSGFRINKVLRSEFLISSATLGGFVVLIVVVYGVWLGSTFLNSQARMFDIYQNVPALLVSLGVLIALACGQFDLSAGSMATLGVFLTIGLPEKEGLPVGLAIVIALLVGLVGGLINSFLVLNLRLNAFIATLGTGGVFMGLYTLYSNGQTISLSQTPSVAKSAAWFAGV